MTLEPPPLDRDARALLSAERSVDDALGSDAKSRLRRRLQSTLGAAALGAGVGAGASVAGANAVKGAALGSTAGIAGIGWRVVAGAFVLGAIVGAGVHAVATRHRDAPPSPASVTTVVVEKIVEVPAATSAPSALPFAPTTAPTELAPPSPALAPSPSLKTSAAAGPSATGKDTSLAAERSLLEIARTALARGDAPSALDALGKHQAQFPQGQLSEEREALYVQALAMAGRTAEAKQRADRFRKTWPESMLLPVVDSAVE